MKKKKIIIIGGTGFIGFHLAKFLIKKNYEVISVSRKNPKKIRFLKKVKYIKVNIVQKKKLLKSLKKYLDTDYIINCGGEVEHKKKKKTILSHFNGSINIANIFLNKPLKKFIQIGSGLEYGSLKSPQSESALCNPESNYSKAKYLASKSLLDLYKNYNLPLVLIRPYQLYGPAQDTNRLIPFVIKACLQNKHFPCSEGKQYRDFLYIDDFVNFIFKIIRKDNIKGEIFNVGYGRPEQIKKIIYKITKIINKGRPKFGKIKLRTEENLITYANIKKAMSFTEWKPKVKLISGLQKTIKYYKKLYL